MELSTIKKQAAKKLELLINKLTLQVEEGIKQCKEDQKQDQEQLQQTLLAAIAEKQRVIQDLVNKKRGTDFFSLF